MRIIGRMFSRGRITIPKKIREKAGIVDREKVAFDIENKRLTLRLVRNT